MAFLPIKRGILSRKLDIANDLRACIKPKLRAANTCTNFLIVHLIAVTLLPKEYLLYRGKGKCRRCWELYQFQNFSAANYQMLHGKAG
jgi:hypothetical protein